jgi:uncharacterized membrane protein
MIKTKMMNKELAITAVALYLTIGLPLVSFAYWVNPMLSGIAICLSGIIGVLLAPIVLSKIKNRNGK